MKKRKFIILIFGIILLTATLFIGIGIALNDMSKPQYIYSKVIDIYKNKLDSYKDVSKDLNFKDKYSIKGNVDFDLDSEYYKKSTKEEDKKTLNLINNLNKSDINFLLQKNESKDTGYIELTQKIDDEDIIDAKYYISDSTKYYFIKGVVDTYINDGACNYFESINANNTEKENIDYLYNFVINSIKNNLKDDYFEIKEEKNNYVSIIKIDNDTINIILNNVLKDLKKDKKSRSILDNIDKNILKTKANKKVLQKDEYYKISIYTTKILHKPLKYKVEHISNLNSKTYTYEGNENKGTLYYLENNTLKYKVNLELSKNEIKAKIKDSSDKNIGEFKLEKDNYNTTLTYTYHDGIKKIDAIYSSKYSNVKKNSSYTNIRNLSFKYVENKETKLNGNVTMTLKASTKFAILADISNAKLKSNLTDKEKENLNKIYENIKNRLER